MHPRAEDTAGREAVSRIREELAIEVVAVVELLDARPEIDTHDGEEDEPWGRLLEVWVDPPEGTPATGEPFEMPAQPAGVYLLDENLLNNAWRAERQRKPALYRGLRLMLQTQSQLSFAGLIG